MQEMDAELYAKTEEPFIYNAQQAQRAGHNEAYHWLARVKLPNPEHAELHPIACRSIAKSAKIRRISNVYPLHDVHVVDDP